MPTSLSEETEREILALYLGSDVQVQDILHTYNLTNGKLYSLLNRNGIKRRQKHTTQSERIAQIQIAPASEPEPPIMPTTTDVAVTVDSNGFVERIEREAPHGKLYTWEVRFESAIRVETRTIVEAISEVQRLPMCRRVFGVSLKAAP